MMSSFLVKGRDADRAAEYRRRAEEVLTHAMTSSDERTRAWFIDIANGYQTLAEHVEHSTARKTAKQKAAAVERYAKVAHDHQLGGAGAK